MFSETIIMDTIIGMIANGAVNMTKDKIKNLHKNSCARSENFYIRIYNAVLNAFEKYCGSYYKDLGGGVQDHILDIAELFIKQCMTYDNSKGLKDILNQHLGLQLSDSEMEVFTDILYSNIVEDEKLRKEYNVRSKNEILNSTSPTGSSVYFCTVDIYSFIHPWYGYLSF